MDDAERIAPRPKDGSPVVVAAVDGIVLTWVGVPPGVPGPGEIAGDGSAASRRLIAELKRLWAEPIEVDHPSWAGPVWTIPEDVRGVIAALLHVGRGRGIILDAPADAMADLFADEAPGDPNVS